ncbi:MAG TPA: hypothetical protein PLP09_10120 [Petrotogaceae bacterium]|nr:hypothetical protein [Petrotogaceae bacterium]
MKKLLLSIIFICTISLLFALDFKTEFSKEIFAGQDFNISIYEESLTFTDGFIYFRKAGDPQFKSIDMSIFRKNATGFIPYSILQSSTYEFYIQLQDTNSTMYRLPQKLGQLYSFEVKNDTVPPLIKLLSPLKGQVFYNDQSIDFVMFIQEDQSFIDSDSIEFLVNGAKITGYNYENGFLTYKIDQPQLGTYKVSLKVMDIYSNKAELKEFELKVENRPAPIFDMLATLNYSLSVGSKYEAKKSGHGITFEELLPENPNSDVTITPFSFEQKINIQAILKMWIFKLGLKVEMNQTNADIQKLFADFTNQAIYDFYDFNRILNPLNFENFNTSSSAIRKIGQSNFYSLYADFGILKYAFGDTKLNFSSNTVTNLNARGHYAKIDLYLASLEAMIGNIDPGVYSASYPRFMAGVNAGINVFDFFKLNADLSVLSDYQGKEGNRNTVALFNIPTGTTPKENILAGVQTSLDFLDFLKLKAYVNGDLYVQDASNVLEVEDFAQQIGKLMGEAVKKQVLDYSNLAKKYFPQLFNYFPLSGGLVASVADKNLWGLIYGAEAEIPSLGLSGYYIKADKNYKSLGSSALSNALKYGGKFKSKLGFLDLKAEYEHKEDNIKDILTYEILPLLKISKVPTLTGGISNINDKAKIQLGLPLGNFGNIGIAYTFEMKTNSDKTKNELSNSGEAEWAGIGFKNDIFSLTINAKGGAGYVQNLINSTNFIEYLYGGNAGIELFGFGLNGEYQDTFTGFNKDQIKENTYGGGFKLPLFSLGTFGIKYSNLNKTLTYSGQKTLITDKFKADLNSNIWIFKVQIQGEYSLIDNIQNGIKETVINVSGKVGLEF